MYSSHLEGTTGSCGEPSEEINPFAPHWSRVRRDPFVHYIEDSIEEEEIIRFWFPSEFSGTVMPVDFEILQPTVRWLDNKQLNLNVNSVINLILMVYFQEYTDNFYKNAASKISFRDLSNNNTIEVIYPEKKISKHEIA